MRSTARRDGDEYVLNGSKRFITNAGVASLYTVFAKTDPDAGHSGISAFVVEADTPGFEVTRLEPKPASRGRRRESSRSRTCASPRRTSSVRRVTASSTRCGSSTARVRESERKVSGSRRARPTTRSSTPRTARRWASRSQSTQLIAGKLADMETACEAARGLLYKFGEMVDQGVDGGELTKASAQAKLFCTDTAMWVTTEAVQILGGYGYIKEYPVERMMRDAKITQIYEGTNEIQRLVIAREMLKENRAFLLTGVAAQLGGPRPLSGRRGHEGRPLRVLRRGCACDRAAPESRPALHVEATTARDQRAGLLPEASPEGATRLDPDSAVHDAPARRWLAARRLRPRQLARGAALDGADELHRHERVVLARR